MPFYERFNQIRTEHHIIDELVFNLDETSINFTQKYKGRAIITSDMPPPVTAQPDRAASSTLVLCIPISGKALDSTLIWPQKTCPAEFSSFPVKGLRVQCEPTSWQTRASFERMMSSYYIPEMTSRRERLHTTNSPILLLVDGHTSRLSHHVIEECVRKNIILMILPSHTSNTTQPLDCDPNGVLKAQFCKECAVRVNYKRTQKAEAVQTETTSPSDELPSTSPTSSTGSQTQLEKLSSIIFPDNGPFVGTSLAHRNLLRDVLPLAIEAATLSHCIENGWRKSGLAPFNPEIALAGLPEGCKIPDPKNYPPISSRVITDPEMRTSIYSWKLQQAERKLAKLTNPSPDYNEVREEIEGLKSTIATINIKASPPADEPSEPNAELSLNIKDSNPEAIRKIENQTERSEDASFNEDHNNTTQNQATLTEEEIQQFEKPHKRTLEEIQQSTFPKKENKQKKHGLQPTRAPSTRIRRMNMPENVVSWDDFEALENWME